MKFTLTFKCPDVLDQVDNPEPNEDPYIEEEWDKYYSNKAEISKIVEKFIRWGELITVEFDTETLTAVVIG